MSSGFVTETEAAEARKRRQEEWEKVRTADQPLERPEEPYDGRSLFDRLKEQKMRKDEAYEEAHKLKNLVRGLDDEEVQFLEQVDKKKMDVEFKQLQEVEQELKEFRNRVATLHEESIDKKIQSELKQPRVKQTSANVVTRPTQKSLLGGGVAIKRKNGKPSNDVRSSAEQIKSALPNDIDEAAGPSTTTPAAPLRITTNLFDKGELKCIAILPGIGRYTESSDSEISTGSDDEPEMHSHYDLVGRKRQKKKQCQDE